MKVRRLPIDPGPAAWNRLLPQPQSAPAFTGLQSADWLIIGAGFAGLAAAHRLSELHPGDKITVLEATTVADGPAGRNSGFMIDVPHVLSSSDYGGEHDQDLREIRLNRAGIRFALDCATKLELPAEAISLSGKLNAAATTRGLAHNRAYAKHLDTLNEPYERLDAHEMQALTGTVFYHEGLFSPGTAMLQPAMFIRGLATGLNHQRVNLYENSPVIALARDGSNWRATTPGGKVAAPRVILAVNGHAESFGFFRRQLLHVFTYASMSRVLTTTEISRLGGVSRWALTPADPLGTTVRRIAGTGGDRLIIRNRATLDPSMQVSHNRVAAMGKTQDKSFRARFPMLTDVTMEYRWGGRLCLSRNSVPAFGELETGLFACCCQNGLGTAKGTVSGMLAADLASERSSPLLSDIQSFAAPANLPAAPLTWLGGNASIRWNEWRAGREL